MNASVQAFPDDGLLAKNLNLTFSDLAKRIGTTGGAAFSYVVRTVEFDRTDLRFEQHGSAPNFQGSYLTLCTCKHQMRSCLDSSEWKGTWVAGVTSRCRYQRRHWLFYLTRVSRAYESHADLWHSLPAVVQAAKSAQKQYLGDLFRPKGRLAGNGRYDPRRYFTPSRHSHRQSSCDNGWHNDIEYWCADRYGRPSLLVGDPKFTFLWAQPFIFFDDAHCRNFKKWKSLIDLLGRLRAEAS